MLASTTSRSTVTAGVSSSVINVIIVPFCKSVFDWSCLDLAATLPHGILGRRYRGPALRDADTSRRHLLEEGDGVGRGRVMQSPLSVSPFDATSKVRQQPRIAADRNASTSAGSRFPGQAAPKRGAEPGSRF